MTTDLLIAQRVKRCDDALTGYSDDNSFISLIDLLADTMHWCRSNGTDFPQALDIAERHFQTETIEQTGVYP